MDTVVCVFSSIYVMLHSSSNINWVPSKRQLHFRNILHKLIVYLLLSILAGGMVVAVARNIFQVTDTFHVAVIWIT